MTDNNSLSFEVDVRAPADRVWQALIDPDLTQRYYFNTRVNRTGNRARPSRTGTRRVIRRSTARSSNLLRLAGW